MVKHSQKYILGFIAKLIHPNAKLDSYYFPANQLFWDDLVKCGSSHFVLPSIYGAVKRKKIEKHLPNDLLLYLKEIYDLNKNQNKLILEQMSYLAKILNKNQIKYVFLKGAALLVLRPYDSVRERMLGDIDILVKKNDLIKAKKILLNKGFKTFSQDNIDFGEDIKEIYKKHLPRLIHKDFIAAVELHEEILEYKNVFELSSKSIFDDMNFHKFYPLPSKNNLWKHAIFNWQYNDYGFKHNKFSLRSFLDVVSLEPKNFDNKLTLHPAINHFYSFCSLFIDKYQNKNFWNTKVYLMKLNYPKINSFINLSNKVETTTLLIFNRLILIIKSKTYRNRVFKNHRLLIKKISSFWSKL